MRRGGAASAVTFLAAVCLASCASAAPTPHATVPPVTTAVPTAPAGASTPPSQPVSSASATDPTGAVGTAAPSASPSDAADADPGPSAYPATKAGAEAIAKAYFESTVLGVQLNSLESMRALTAPNCPCLNQLGSYIGGAIKQGRHSIDGQIKDFALDSYRRLSKSRSTVLVSLGESATRVVDSTGSVVAVSEAQAIQQFAVTLIEISGTWRVEDAQVLRP